MNMPTLPADAVEIRTDYYVTRSGEIWSVKGGIPRSRRLSPNVLGYNRVQLHLSGKRVCFLVHRLVAEAFIPNDTPELRKDINHKNSVRDDNRAENLEWVTRGENNAHGYASGNNKHRKKLNESVRHRVKSLRSNGLTQLEVAKQLGVAPSTISYWERTTARAGA